MASFVAFFARCAPCGRRSPSGQTRSEIAAKPPIGAPRVSKKVSTPVRRPAEYEPPAPADSQPGRSPPSQPAASRAGATSGAARRDISLFSADGPVAPGDYHDVAGRIQPARRGRNTLRRRRDRGLQLAPQARAGAGAAVRRSRAALHVACPDQRVPHAARHAGIRPSPRRPRRLPAADLRYEALVDLRHHREAAAPPPVLSNPSPAPATPATRASSGPRHLLPPLRRAGASVPREAGVRLVAGRSPPPGVAPLHGRGPRHRRAPFTDPLASRSADSRRRPLRRDAPRCSPRPWQWTRLASSASPAENSGSSPLCGRLCGSSGRPTRFTVNDLPDCLDAEGTSTLVTRLVSEQDLQAQPGRTAGRHRP